MSHVAANKTDDHSVFSVIFLLPNLAKSDEVECPFDSASKMTTVVVRSFIHQEGPPMIKITTVELDRRVFSKCTP